MKTINEMISMRKLNIGPKLVTTGESPSDGCMCKVPIQSSEKGFLYCKPEWKTSRLRRASLACKGG